MAIEILLPPLFQKMLDKETKLLKRKLLVTTELNNSEIPYSIIGGNAVNALLTHFSDSYGVSTRDLNVLLRRNDINSVEKVLGEQGFRRRRTIMGDVFLDPNSNKVEDAVHILVALEKVKLSDSVVTPDVDEYITIDNIRYANVNALVRMKLTAYRNKDKGHIDLLIEQGIVTLEEIALLPATLGARLLELFQNHQAGLSNAIMIEDIEEK